MEADVIDIHDLSEHDKEIARSFINSLKVQANKKAGKFKFNWAGKGKGKADNMTSVELQHKSMDWRCQNI